MNAELNRNHMKQKQAKTLNTTQQLINLTNQKNETLQVKSPEVKGQIPTKQNNIFSYVFVLHTQSSLMHTKEQRKSK